MRDANLLYVDLTSKKIEKKTLAGDIYEKYPGGSSLSLYILLHEMDPNVDPLGPDNMLIFAVSPLTGIPFGGQGRMCASAKSPLTDTIGDSEVGGYIGAKLASNGWDAVVFKGKSETPVYLYIDKENAELRDATPMWGKYTADAEEWINEDLGGVKNESHIIGPAGENQVLYASIMHQRSRANGRNGIGAVMGSKNLKALAVKNAPARKPAEPALMKEFLSTLKEDLAPVAGFGEVGTAPTVDAHAAEGFIPSLNWDAGTFDGWETSGGNYMNEHYLIGRETCFGCGIKCKRVIEIPGRVDPKYGGPEYESMSTLGSYCGVSDNADICEANMLCNMYGLDTMSAGATIAWAMDCYEHGILTKDQTDGLDLHFGNGPAMIECLHKIAYKKPGIGELLAKGSYRAAQEIGNGAEDLLVVNKKQEWPAHMPQMKPNMSLIYGVNPFGADHQSCEQDPALLAPKDSPGWVRLDAMGDFEQCTGSGVLDDNKAKYTWAVERLYSATDTLCLCQFVWGASWQMYGPERLSAAIKAAAGLDWDMDQILEIGARRVTMMRLFNNKLGYSTREDDLNMPKKTWIPITDAHGNTVGLDPDDFEKTLDAYYKYAGIDPETGAPLPETVEKLGLTWFTEGKDDNYGVKAAQ